MASDKRQLYSALIKWEGLKEEGATSVCPDVGRTAIVVTPGGGTLDTGITSTEEHKLFVAEAERLAERIEEDGGRPELYAATAQDMQAVLTDRGIADIYAVGHGTLSSLKVGSHANYDWKDASDDADHLKLGRFVQRQCGAMSRSLNVPLGLFVVSDPRNVLAAVGEVLPSELTPEHEPLFVPVYDTPDITALTILDGTAAPTPAEL